MQNVKKVEEISRELLQNPTRDTEENHKNLNQDIQRSTQEVNRGPSENKWVLTIRLRYM